MEWMAWTWPTAAFFMVLISLLTAMTIWQIKTPTDTRRGWLPLSTTRGDRLFIGLLSSAFLHLFWLMLIPASVFIISFICLLLIIVLIRFG